LIAKTKGMLQRMRACVDDAESARNPERLPPPARMRGGVSGRCGVQVLSPVDGA